MDITPILFEKARAVCSPVVYPEGDDPRILEAAVKAQSIGICKPIVLGEPDRIRSLAGETGVKINNLTIVSVSGNPSLQRYAQTYSTDRKIKTGVAARIIRKPLFFGGMMVKSGDAAGMVCGAASSSALVIQAASLAVGYEAGVSTPSSFFIMSLSSPTESGDEVVIFADSGFNISPNARQLAEIAVASGHSARKLLGIDPRIALLSFSTKGSASHSDIDKVREAVTIAREMNHEFAIDGELQGDAAIVPAVAAKKAPGSDVAGQANVLIFPDLNAGNIAYKLVQYLAGAKAFGPILQGFARPVNDLSRGASVDDIVGVTAITVIQSSK